MLHSERNGRGRRATHRIVFILLFFVVLPEGHAPAAGQTGIPPPPAPFIGRPNTNQSVEGHASKP
jgi:hypothetical protein